MEAQPTTILPAMYDRLSEKYGPQHWWPGDSPAEVVVGAILTQNTAWTNVEAAIKNLKRENVLTFTALRDMARAQLELLIQPAGTFRIKAKRLKAFIEVLWNEHDGSLEVMLEGELDDARQRLLAIHGVGPETADAILLYAGNRPTFVVDAYTNRILRRHFLIDLSGKSDYESVRRLFHECIPPESQVYNEYHALIVEVGKRHCKKRANCEGCPLAIFPHDEQL